jgi:hypothetical protein
MRHSAIRRENSAPAEKTIEEVAPRPDPPVARYTHKIVLNVFGKRFELTRHVEVREITSGPARVIEMPGSQTGEQ